MKFYNFSTKKVYESDGEFVVSIKETPLRNDVTASEYEDETFYSYDEAIEYINDVLCPKILGNEGFGEGDYETKSDGMTVTVTVPNFKEWVFTINGDNILECLEAKANGKKLDEFMAGGTDYQSTFADFEKYVKVIPEFRDIFRELHTLGQWNDSAFAVSQGKEANGMEKVTKDYAEYICNKLNKVMALLANRSMDANNKDSYYKIKAKDLIELLPDLKELATISWSDGPVGIQTIKSAAGRAYSGIKELEEKEKKLEKFTKDVLEELRNRGFEIKEFYITDVKSSARTYFYEYRVYDKEGEDYTKAVSQEATSVKEYLESKGYSPKSNESVATRFAKYRAMFESDDEDENAGDEGSSEEGGEGSESGSDEGGEGSSEEDADKKGDEGEDEDAEMTAIVLTVAHGDGEKLKKEMLDAKDDNDEDYGFDEENIEIIEGEDDEDDKVKIDASEAFNLKKFLKDKKDIDLEDEIGGEIVDDSEEDSDDEGSSDDEGGEGSDEEGKGGEDGEDFNFDDLGDLFGADETE